ncbi:MAG TPA: ABATE domain-containing protein [Solirubrobacteraceae bacterium]|jgi:predicted RNA-binding Zn ribbon-like protein|nr:ABATE domain-containing protein [Solirubrobacteraceae bacterium]
MRPVHDLPERLALPLATGEPWWYWLGGRPALDLVNTLRERWRRRVETLVTPDDLGLWLTRAGVLAEPLAVAPEVLDEARVLREAIDACVSAVVEGAPAPAGAVGVIDRLLVHAGTRPQLGLDDGGRPVLGERPAADSARRALGAIALDAARMLGTPAEAARVRICASDTCSARFYDRSPAGRRRWCSMRACGNEAKARRHRARARSGA